jgi:4-hydroxyphenylpyruvate dioxygenase
MVMISIDSSIGRVRGIRFVELYVSSLKQAEQFYVHVLGLKIAHTPVLERDKTDRVSTTLESGDIRIVLTSPLGNSSAVTAHIQTHGEGVKNIALNVTNIDQLFEKAIQNGATAILSPITQNSPGGSFRSACIGVAGDLVHTLVEDNDYHRLNSIDSPAYCSPSDVPSGGLESIDHLALALNEGDLDRCAKFYIEAFGFCETHNEQVSTEYSAMKSKVVQSANGRVRLPLTEPAVGRRKSQIKHYLESHVGPGVQHIAFRSSDIIASVTNMTAAGMDFLPTPETYYHDLQARVGHLSNFDDLKRFGILVDRDVTGHLLQVFTKPIGRRPTLFLELIERQGAEGFGSGNIKALFEAVERAHLPELPM